MVITSYALVFGGLLTSSFSYMSPAHWEAFHRNAATDAAYRLSNPGRESERTPAAPKRRQSDAKATGALGCADNYVHHAARARA